MSEEKNDLRLCGLKFEMFTISGSKGSHSNFCWYKVLTELALEMISFKLQ